MTHVIHLPINRTYINGCLVEIGLDPEKILRDKRLVEIGLDPEKILRDKRLAQNICPNGCCQLEYLTELVKECPQCGFQHSLPD